MLPFSLFLLLCSSFLPVFSALTSPSDPFRTISVHKITKPPLYPVCQLTASPAIDSVEEDLLSFEEWKAKRFAQEAQGKARAKERDALNRSISSTNSPHGSSTNAPSTIQYSADSTNTAVPTSPDTVIPVTPAIEDPVVASLISPHFRVPLTDRFNYAALDCSARVHTSHRSAKSTSSILSYKRDKYMLSPCATPRQHVVVELCEDIRIDTVQLANYEFFSGVFKDFTVSVAKTYTTDPEGWTVAGSYRAKNVRGVQSFHPPTSLRDFYRFIRIDFHSHYGNEYYCPVSLLRVYGLTHLEEWKWDIWSAEAQAKRDDLFESVSINLPTVDEPVHHELGDDVLPGGSAIPHEAGAQVLAPNPPPSSIATTDDGGTTAESASEAHSPTLLATPRTATFDSPFSADIQSNSESIKLVLETMLASSRVEPSPFDISFVQPETSTLLSTNEPSPSSVSSQPTTATSTATSSSTTTGNTPPPAQPPLSTGGESIYRTIMNRLTVLELNTTLTARYVEDQTAGVRDVLKRLAEDVGRVEGINKAQALLLQRTLAEWERQRTRIDAEHRTLTAKVNYLSDEITLEKRLGVAQLLLLLAVLVFMGLTRGSRNDPQPYRSNFISFDKNDHVKSPAAPKSGGLKPPVSPAKMQLSLSTGSQVVGMRANGYRPLSLSGDWKRRIEAMRGHSENETAGKDELNGYKSLTELKLRTPEYKERHGRRRSITPTPVKSSRTLGRSERSLTPMYCLPRHRNETETHFQPSFSARLRPPNPIPIQQTISGGPSGSAATRTFGVGSKPWSVRNLARSANWHEVKGRRARNKEYSSVPLPGSSLNPRDRGGEGEADIFGEPLPDIPIPQGESDGLKPEGISSVPDHSGRLKRPVIDDEEVVETDDGWVDSDGGY